MKRCRKNDLNVGFFIKVYFFSLKVPLVIIGDKAGLVVVNYCNKIVIYIHPENIFFKCLGGLPISLQLCYGRLVCGLNCFLGGQVGA